MNIDGYTPTLGFKVESARNRGLIDDKILYKIGILMEGFYYCQQSLILPPTKIVLKDLQEELKNYSINIEMSKLVDYLLKLSVIQYTTDSLCVPLFAFFSVKQDNGLWECCLSFNPYF